MKKPAAKAKPVLKPVVPKTPAAKSATSSAKKASTPSAPAKKVSVAPAKTVRAVKAAPPAPARKAVAKKSTPKAAPVAAASSKPTGRSAEPPAPSLPMKKTAAASTSAPATTPVTSIPAAPAPAARGGRVSRLSQLTVPSMAQSVASTAAKSSFTQSAPALVPPPPLAVKKDPKLANNWKTKSAEELTDQEVIAMPDSEYMNEKQMAFFRLKLIELKRGILENAGETTEHLREDTVVVPDPADRATIEEEHALELRTRDRERKLLKKIEQSIQRIDAGDYGYCDETGEPIGVGRLLARPTATLSLEAQQRRELKQKMFGD